MIDSISIGQADAIPGTLLKKQMEIWNDKDKEKAGAGSESDLC